MLTCRHSTTTSNVFFGIKAGWGQTELASYTVPAGYTAYLKTYRIGMFDNTANNGVAAFWTREYGGAVRLQRPFPFSTAFPLDAPLYSGVAFPEKTDISMRVISVKNNGADVESSFELLLIKN